MKQQLKPLAISLCLLGMISVPALAETSSAQSTNSSQQIESVEKQVATLQKEVHALKGEMKSSHRKTSYHGYTKSAKTQSTPAASTATTSAATTSGPDSYVSQPNITAARLEYFPVDVDVPGKSLVSSGPYIGVPFLYSGGELIINTPSINEDVALLNIRKGIKQKLQALGRVEAADHAHLLLSGIIEAQGMYKDPVNGPTTSDIDLTSAELDGYVLGPSSWTSGILSFAYDNNIGASTGSLNNNARTQNARVFVNKAFIVLGNFSESPWYGTIGQMYVPFGTYGSNMVSSPLTKLLARTKARALLVGFQQQSTQAFYGSGYIFRGDTYVGAARRLDNGGINLGYRYVHGNYSGDFGGGVIANIADSDGMQNNGYGSPYFGGFGATSGFGNEQIAHRVPAMNVHGTFSIGDHVTLLGEYVGAINSFSMNDLTLNAHGAKPRAARAEAAYTFSAFDRPSTVAAGYGRTKDALALGLPLQRYSLVFNTSIWKDTLQSLELRHDMNYAQGNYASGTGSAVTAPITGPGASDNAVTAQFDMYF